MSLIFDDYDDNDNFDSDSSSVSFMDEIDNNQATTANLSTRCTQVFALCSARE